MKKEKFDEELKEALREYVKDTESEPIEKIKFSKRHEKNMEAIFKSIENGTLGNFEVESNSNDEVKDNAEIKSSARGFCFSYSRLARVAIFVIFALVISLAVAPGLEAWRTDELNLYGENQDDYAWLLPNNITERLEVDGEDTEEYLEIFGYLPEGAKIEKVVDGDETLYVKFNIVNNNIFFRVHENNKTIIDIEDSMVNKIDLNDKSITCYSKDGVDTYVWVIDKKMYRIYGDIQEQEILRIIEKINYKKIGEIF